MALTQLHEDLWVTKRPLRFFGVEIGTHMTVVRFGDDLLLHSPVKPDDELKNELADLGQVKWVAAPNKFHHLFVNPWIEMGAEAFAPRGLMKKRSDLSWTGDFSAVPWPDALAVHQMNCIPFTEEAVFYHAPSNTLITTDLLFNISPDAPLMTRIAIGAAGAYPGICCTTLEKMVIKRKDAPADFEKLFAWNANRIILAHGEVVEEGGNEAFRKAYSWLGVNR